MAERMLVKGNEAFGEAAIRYGSRAYFAYPITPQSEVAEYISKRMPEVGGVFLQGESEVAVINMLYGASAAGARVFTTTSSPGFALMQEGISYMAGAKLPALIINVCRGGPGLGNIAPSQEDYHQTVKFGGNGNYKTFVLAPHTIQEAVDLIGLGFELADKYRMLSVILADGMLGQMMEPVEYPEMVDPATLPKKDWAMTGAKGREPNLIDSFELLAEDLEKWTLSLLDIYKKAEKEVRYEEYNMENPDIIVTGFGTVARILKTVIDMGKKDGINIGLIRPITLWPFPKEVYKKASEKVNTILTVEMNDGQMVEDVRACVKRDINMPFYGRVGGVVPTPEEIYEQVKKYVK